MPRITNQRESQEIQAPGGVTDARVHNIHSGSFTSHLEAVNKDSSVSLVRKSEQFNLMQKQLMLLKHGAGWVIASANI